MHDPNLSAIDLNLLVIFDAVMRDRSVSRAAQRVHRTQPAVSHALGRLRSLFRDPLFVRTPAGMQPTPLAERMAPRVAEVLDEIGALLIPSGEFDARHSRRRFTVGMTDYAADALVPPLVRILGEEAPHVELVVRPANLQSGIGIIDRGEADLVIAIKPAGAPSYISSSLLYSIHLVCTARRGHPAFAKELTREDYVRCPHLNISQWGGAGPLDEKLAQYGVTRRIALTISHFSIAPSILEGIDLIATLPEGAARQMAARHDLVIQESPFDLGQYQAYQLWHSRFDFDPGLIWLRRQIELAAEKP